MGQLERHLHRSADPPDRHYFIEAVLGKAKAIAPVPIGQEAAVSERLPTLSHRNNKEAYGDENTGKYRFP